MNEQIFFYLNSFVGHSILFDFLIVFFATYFGYFFLGLVFYEEFFRSKESKEKRRNNLAYLFMILVGATIAYFLSQIINNLYPTPRPDLVFSSVINIMGKTGMDSFPSGHATFFFALAFLFYSNYKKYFYPALLVAILTAISRIIGGAHWPVDILGGMLLAFIVSLVLNPLFGKIHRLFR